MAMKPTDQEIGSLYREAGATGPSAELDRNILAAARAAVEKPAAPAPWWRRWRLPLQAVATICLVAMLTVMVGRQEPPAPAVPPLAMNQAGPAADSRQADRATAPAAPIVAESRERMAPQAPARSKAQANPEMGAAAPSPATQAQPAARSEHALAAAPTANLVAAEAENTAAPAKAEARAAPAAKATARMAADQAMSPTAWLDSIQLLIDQNRLDEARKRLEAFTQAYPGENVPEGMRAKLKPIPEAANAKPQ